MREHREQGPAPPGQPSADLVFIEPGQALTGLKTLLDGPAASCDADQLTEWDRAGVIAAVEGEFAVAGGAAGQQAAGSRPGRQRDQGPAVGALPPCTPARVERPPGAPLPICGH